MKRFILIGFLLLYTTFTLSGQSLEELDSLIVHFEKKGNYDKALLYANKALKELEKQNLDKDTTYANLLLLTSKLNTDRR